MRIGIVDNGSRRSLAVATPTGYVDVAAAAAKDPSDVANAIARAQGVEEILRLGDAGLKAVERLAEGAPVATDPARWRSPLLAPAKICGIGLNYADHCREQGLEPPKNPILFAKYANAIVGPGDEIVWNPTLTSMVDWEAELAVVIGRRARDVTREEAFDHVAGYVVANDVTARNLQKGDGQFVRAKTLDTFCPLGPQLVTRDEVPDPHKLRIRSRVNGVTKQDSSTSNLIFGVDVLVSFLSEAFTLEPGDVILTGTPPGVGMHRKPPEFLRDGDVVEIEIEGLGVLSNRCRTASPVRPRAASPPATR